MKFSTNDCKAAHIVVETGWTLSIRWALGAQHRDLGVMIVPR